MPAGKTENIKQVRLSQLFPFERHPFKMNNDAEMLKIVESVKQYGVLSPAIARPLPDGGYELVSGHRRKRACELAGLETMPVIVRELDDDAAAILVVDSNLQREGLLPSERAFAYRLKLEAMQHQGQRKDLTSVQVEPKLRARDVIAQEVGESSGVQVQRYVRLTELIPPLLDMVDERKIAFNPAYKLSFLKQDEQQLLHDAMDSEQATPSLSQAQRLKQFSQRGELTAEIMRAIMSEEKKKRSASPSRATRFANTFQPATHQSVWKRPLLSCWNSGKSSRNIGGRQSIRNKRKSTNTYMQNISNKYCYVSLFKTYINKN